MRQPEQTVLSRTCWRVSSRRSKLTSATRVARALILCVLTIAGHSLAGCKQADTIAASSAASEEDSSSRRLLGRIDFPNSGSAAAQEPFLRGVKFLHNFEYADARSAFQEATAIDADFVLAYWGEAMTHNHPIWQQQDREAATAALAQLAPTPQDQLAKSETERERGYLQAAHVLFGLSSETKDLDKETRDDLFRVAMAELALANSDDHEAATFSSLAILGTAHEGRDFRTYMQAAAVAGEVWEANDQHPGAAHYLIHSFDDPVHAPLGLPMARAYAQIAPDAGHAQHMTSHIFVALGLWDDVATANEAARRVQTTRQRELGESETVCGHYPYWLQYAYLQQGRTADAQQVLSSCEQRIKAEADQGELWHYAMMRGRQVLDAPEGNANPELLVDISSEVGGFSDHLFLSAYQAALSGDTRKANAAITPLEKATSRGNDDIPKVQALQIRGLIDIANGRSEAGLRTLLDAALLQESMPYAFGPPEVLKPAWELLGEQQLATDVPALDAFRKQLERTPRRIQALQGLARAYMRAGKTQEAERLEQVIQTIATAAGG